MAAVPARLQALGGQAPPQLRHHAMHGGQVGQRAGGKRAVQLAERSRRRQVPGALDLRALELAPQERLEAAQRLARQALAARVVGGQLGLGLGAQSQRATDALHVHADHPGALLAAGEGGDRHAREVAHRALRALAHRLRDLRAQLVELGLGQFREAHPVLLAHAVARGGGLSGAEKEALEDQLEDPAVLLTLGQRRGERLAEVLLGGPADLAEHGEGVEELGGSHRDSLAAQLLAELQKTCRQRLRRHRQASAA